jgi:hypothetical protein
MLCGRTRTPGNAVAESLFQSSAQLNRQIFEEDHQICRRVSPTYCLDAPDRLFAASEDRLRHFSSALKDCD